MIRIGLGTVQLGLPYGNTGHLMAESDAFNILRLAKEFGIQNFDTAFNYGESEVRLGAFGLAGDPQVRIFTKIPQVSPDVWRSPAAYWKYVSDCVSTSKTRLRTEKFSIIFFHQCDLDFIESECFRLTSERMLTEGFCDAVGISVYDPEQALAATQLPSISTLQIPVNILDHRFTQSSFLKKIPDHVRLVGRSIYLQGVLVKDAKVPQVKKTKILEKLKAMAIDASENAGCELSVLCVNYVFKNLESVLSVGLVGVDSEKALSAFMRWYDERRPVTQSELACFDEVSAFAGAEGLLNPLNWYV